MGKEDRLDQAEPVPQVAIGRVVASAAGASASIARRSTVEPHQVGEQHDHDQDAGEPGIGERIALPAAPRRRQEHGDQRRAG